ncbi:cob(I)yrinic acid a,c-diamide adenosyltransferase [Brevundimonas sp. NIBR11]|uniref:cob(I)yrinic acid a,c-diamide adenosyltransferase n=1 Tax=Brevundimonas sp. NIBR11 TaxID=3015999 RepID=UPI0022F096CE|nr:cob(I)yrinic acid a,c-diamide adenosyltransferase [Brevundimonas sp. NIBR11]WGM31159.1 Corrinoid adenosyltransferase [Brevundimonas sp. NIBR11]
MNDKTTEAEHAEAMKALVDPRIHFVLLDELNIALRYDDLHVHGGVAELVARPEGKHVCVADRNAWPDRLAFADLMTETTVVKHPFDRGVRVQRGSHC